MSILFFNQIQLTHIQVIGYFTNFRYIKKEELSIALVPLYSHTHIFHILWLTTFWIVHAIRQSTQLDSSYFPFIHIVAS